MDLRSIVLDAGELGRAETRAIDAKRNDHGEKNSDILRGWAEWAGTIVQAGRLRMGAMDLEAL